MTTSVDSQIQTAAGTLSPDSGSGYTPWPRALMAGLAGAAAVCVILLAFAWPTVTSTPHDLPVAVVGSSEQIAQVQAQAPEGVLAIHQVADRDEAIEQIKKRSVYGGVVLGAEPEILVAGAASPAAAQALKGLGTQMNAQIQATAIEQLQGKLAQIGQAAAHGEQPQLSAPGAGEQGAGEQEVPHVAVTDVVPLSEDDAQGTGLVVASLPLVLGGMLGGILISLLVTGTWRRLGAILANGILAGLGLVAILQGWFHFLQGSFWLNVVAVGLSVMATSGIIVGLNSLVGKAGIAIGAVLTVLVGNPLSAVAAPKEFLPGAWGGIGQWMVPGATGNLIRDISYFPEASSVFPWLVLAGWVVAGGLLITFGHFRSRPAAITED